MGVFSWIRTRWRRATAVGMLRQLLEMEAKEGNYRGNPETAAGGMVAILWQHSPEFFTTGSSHGTPPGPQCIAVAALAGILERMPVDHGNWYPFSQALSKLLIAIGRRQADLKLNAADEVVLSRAIKIMEGKLPGVFDEFDMEFMGL